MSVVAFPSVWKDQWYTCAFISCIIFSVFRSATISSKPQRCCWGEGLSPAIIPPTFAFDFVGQYKRNYFWSGPFTIIVKGRNYEKNRLLFLKSSSIKKGFCVLCVCCSFCGNKNQTKGRYELTGIVSDFRNCFQEWEQRFRRCVVSKGKHKVAIY